MFQKWSWGQKKKKITSVGNKWICRMQQDFIPNCVDFCMVMFDACGQALLCNTIGPCLFINTDSFWCSFLCRVISWQYVTSLILDQLSAESLDAEVVFGMFCVFSVASNHSPESFVILQNPFLFTCIINFRNESLCVHMYSKAQTSELLLLCKESRDPSIHLFYLCWLILDTRTITGGTLRCDSSLRTVNK